jgi:O-antigen/teichoic acid export membrane protein
MDPEPTRPDIGANAAPSSAGLDAQAVHSRAKRGLSLLIGRQLLILVITFSTGIALARLLEPAEFGLFAIATFIVEGLALLGNFGLAPSLIQQRQAISNLDLAVGFTLQQLVITAIAVVLLISAPLLMAPFPDAPSGTVWLVRTLVLTLYLTSWRSMSVLQLDRELRFERIAAVDVIEVVLYQGLAIGLAWAGYGVWSFAWAAIARGVVGTVLLYAAAPWPIRFKLDKRIAKDILRYGVPFQLQGLANQLGSWITPILVGLLLGPTTVGLLTWASSNAKKPLLLVDNVARVAFPHFSRLQDDRREIERLLERYLTYLLLFSSLWFALLLIASPALIPAIYGDSWSPATSAVILFGLAVSFDVLLWVVAITLNAVGAVGFTTRVVIVRQLAFIALSLGLVPSIGLNGVPIAYLAGSVVVTPWLLRGLGGKTVKHLGRALRWITVPNAVSMAAGALVLLLPWGGALRAILTVSVLVAAFALTGYLSAPPWLKGAIRRSLNTAPARIRTAMA